MSIPNISDLTVFMGMPLSPTDWFNNWTKVCNWLSDGTADISVNSISGMMKLKPLTQAQILALTPGEGWLVMDADSHRPIFFDGQSWQTL